MGGHRAGDVASRLATESISSSSGARPPRTSPGPFTSTRALRRREPAAHRHPPGQSADLRAQPRRASTTAWARRSSALVQPRQAQDVHRATSAIAVRIVIRDGRIPQLTRDHSLVNDYLLVMPDMTEEQRSELPKNVITRALGMQDSVDVDLLAHDGAGGRHVRALLGRAERHDLGRRDFAGRGAERRSRRRLSTLGRAGQRARWRRQHHRRRWCASSRRMPPWTAPAASRQPSRARNPEREAVASGWSPPTEPRACRVVRATSVLAAQFSKITAAPAGAEDPDGSLVAQVGAVEVAQPNGAWGAVRFRCGATFLLRARTPPCVGARRGRSRCRTPRRRR